MNNMNDIWQDNLIKALESKYPTRTELIKVLKNVLHLEKAPIYKRMRKEVPFTVEEVQKIASEFDISWNEITGKKSDFHWVSLNYINPSDEELKHVQNVINHLNNIDNCRDAEYMEVGNKLPQALVAVFPYIIKYQILKWACLYTNQEKTVPFSGTSVPEKLSRLMNECHSAIKNTKHTTYIWDSMVFEDIISDVQYFYSAKYISNKEKKLIKNDLLALLDYLEKICLRGGWPETSNQVDLCISNVSIESNYSYYYSNEYKVCRIHAFGKSEMQSYSPEIIESCKNFIQLRKRMSNLISGSGEKGRAEFFDKQRKMVKAL